MTEKEENVSKAMKQKINVLTFFSMTIMILFIPFLLCACGSGGDSTATVYTSGGDIHTPVEVKLVHGTLLVVNTVVNGSINLNMLVDTGASRTQVPSEIFGNPDVEVYISSLCFENDICFNNFNAWSTDSAFTQSKDGYFNGIIGVDLLKNYDFTFDYKSGLIYFYDILENGSSSLLTVPIHYETVRPFTNISIEGMPQGACLLDTGAAYTRITSLMLDSLSQKPDVLFKSVNFNINGSEMVEHLLLKDYCAGMACPEEIVVQIGGWPAVGGSFFREFLTIFKFSEDVVKLDPYYDRSHIKDSGIQRIGLQINIYDASDIIYVNEGSPAWEGGLREGYEIISVNGIPIDSLGYFAIYELLADTPINEYQFLVVTTDGDTKEITVSIPS
ncbi:MAG: PDZ domain-containing protein [Desulfobacterales bacterium]